MDGDEPVAVRFVRVLVFPIIAALVIGCAQIENPTVDIATADLVGNWSANNDGNVKFTFAENGRFSAVNLPAYFDAPVIDGKSVGAWAIRNELGPDIIDLRFEGLTLRSGGVLPDYTENPPKELLASESDGNLVLYFLPEGPDRPRERFTFDKG